MGNSQALIYVRMSRDREGAGLGVERQERECRELAERLGVTVVGVHADNDLSAYSRKPRPGYRALCEDVRAGRADVVLCWHTDRLHRSPAELENWITICDPRGVPTHTVRGGLLDLSTAAGRMNARITGAVARHESEQKGERIKAQKRQARESGRWLGGPRPFGYAEDGHTLVPEEAKLIRGGVRALLAGGSLRSVVRMFNDSGLPTARGRDWSHRNVPVVLRRWRNAGFHEHQGQRGVRAAWEPVVTEDELREVLEILDGIRARHQPGTAVGSRSRWLLAGIARCPCGAPLRVITSAARPAVYRCATYERGGQTGHVSRRVDPVDAFVEDVITTRLAQRDVAELLIPDGPGVDRTALLAQRRAAQRRLDEIAALLGDGDLTPEQARTASARARVRLAEAEDALAAATRTSPLAKLAAVPNAVEWWRSPSTDLDDRRAVIRALMDITVLPGRPGRRPFDPATVEIRWH